MINNILAKRCIAFLLIFVFIVETPAIYVQASSGENIKSKNRGWFSNVKISITETWFGDKQEKIFKRKKKSSEQEGNFRDSVDTGWKIASEYLGTTINIDSSQAFIESVNLAIQDLEDSINADMGKRTSIAAEAGFVAEKWTAGTFNIDALINGSKETAHVEGSTGLGSVDVSTSYGDSASLKYYQDANESAKAQATSIIKKYSTYKNNCIKQGKEPLSIQEYAEKNGYDVTNAEWYRSIYEGQIRIIPTEQLEEAKAYLEGKIKNLEDIEGRAVSQTRKAYKETLDNLKDRLEAPDGTKSKPLTKEQAQAIAELAESGVFKVEDFGISTAELIPAKYILKQSMSAGMDAAILEAVLEVGPDLFAIIRKGVKEKTLDTDMLKESGIDGLIAASNGFLEGAISNAIYTACVAGKLGEQYKNPSPELIGSLTVIALHAIRYGYALTQGEITQSQYGDLMAEKVITIACAAGGGTILNLLLPMVPFSYQVGSFIGGIIASVGYNIVSAKIEDVYLEVKGAGGFEVFVPEGILQTTSVMKDKFDNINIRLQASKAKDLVMTVYQDGVIRLNLKGEYYCTFCDAILNKQFGFNPDEGYWFCKKCDMLMTAEWTYDGERFPGVYWFCDNNKCNSCLSIQNGFNDLNDIWKCKECGYNCEITLKNIE